MASEQFILAHGHEEFVVTIEVNPHRGHVWSAKDRAQADRWVEFWEARGKSPVVLTMKDYLNE